MTTIAANNPTKTSLRNNLILLWPTLHEILVGSSTGKCDEKNNGAQLRTFIIKQAEQLHTHRRVPTPHLGFLVDCPVGHRRAAAELVQHPAAVEVGRIAAERAAGHRRAAVVVPHPAA